MTRDKLIDWLHDIDVMIRTRYYDQATTDLRILQQVVKREHREDLSERSDHDPLLYSNTEDDGDALASAGFGTDKDYGG